MQRQTIATPAAPAAIGPYSQAVLVDGWLWCSGQISLDPATGAMVGAGTDEAAARVQAEQCLKNLRGVLSAAGASPGDAVRCTVFLKSMDHFAAVNDVYAAFFAGVTPPARACVEVSRLPKDVLVEIDCVARVSA